MALTEHGKNNDGKYELTVKISADDFKKAIDKIYNREKKRINIPGFRKGKAPRAVIEKMFGEGCFYEDALNELLPDEFEKAVDEADIQIIDHPEVDVKEMAREDGVTVQFTCTLRPELEVKQYDGLEAEKAVYSVTDENVQNELKLMQEKQSRIVPVEGRAAEDGDIANIDFEGFIDGKAFDGGKDEKYDLTLGSHQFINGFEEQIVGHNVGDEFDVNVTFPEDYGSKEFAGKNATFKVKLNDLKKKELPELDDEFAKDVSEYDTLDELKASIVKRLEDQNAERSKKELENSLLDKLADNLEGEVPEVMVHDEIHSMLHEFEHRLQYQGLSLENYLKFTNANIEAMEDSMRPEALKNIKTRLALEAVARKEKLEVTTEDIENEFKKYAEEYQMDVDKLRNVIAEKELKENLKIERAIDFIRDHAKVVEKSAEEIAEEVAKKAAEATKALSEAKDEDNKSEEKTAE